MALHLAPAGQLPEQAQPLLAFYGYADDVEVRIRYKHVKGNGRNKKYDGGKKNNRVRIGIQIRPRISLRLCPAVGLSIPWLVMLLYKLVKQGHIQDIRRS